MAKVGAVIYEYYKNAFDGRCEKYTFKACEFDSRQANENAPNRGVFYVEKEMKIYLKKFSLKLFLFLDKYAIIEIKYENEAVYGGKNSL